jgi:hypothetical protein
MTKSANFTYNTDNNADLQILCNHTTMITGYQICS